MNYEQHRPNPVVRFSTHYENLRPAQNMAHSYGMNPLFQMAFYTQI